MWYLLQLYSLSFCCGQIFADLSNISNPIHAYFAAIRGVSELNCKIDSIYGNEDGSVSTFRRNIKNTIKNMAESYDHILSLFIPGILEP